MASVVGGIAMKLASELLKKFGVAILEKVFPPGVPNYFEEVYRKIEEIVKKELTQNTVDVVNGQINGLKEWVNVTYKNAKDSGLSKEDLTGLLQPREPDITIHLVGVLMDVRFAEPGICVFMIAAGIHLAILQELAFIDAKVSSPSQSHYAKSVEEYARTYAEHAKATKNQIIQSRKNMIQPKDEDFTMPTQRGITQYLYSFQDTFKSEEYSSQVWSNITTFNGDSDPDAYLKRNEALEKYTNKKVDELIESLQDPESTADEWLKLIAGHPLPE